MMFLVINLLLIRNEIQMAWIKDKVSLVMVKYPLTGLFTLSRESINRGWALRTFDKTGLRRPLN